MQNQHDEIYKTYRAEYNNAPNLNLKRPVDIAMELSSHCNLRCPYCYHAAKKVPFVKNFMQLKTGLKILSQAFDARVYSVKFNWRGESTLSPHFLKLTRYAYNLSQLDSSVFIDRISNTNLNFLNDRKDIFEGLSLLTKVKVSIDSLQKDIYETQRARGDFDLICKNIDKLHNYYGDNTTIVLQAVRTSLNEDEDLEHDFKKRWPNSEVSIRDCVENRIDDDHQLSIKKKDRNERIPCRQAFARLVFDYDGIAHACCPAFDQSSNVSLRLGNIHERPLLKIFNSPEALILRDDLKTGLAFKLNPACINCSSFETFKGYTPNWDS